ncbi:MAG: hypothetical protein ACOX4J_07655 [Anaerovoracaceae bacterium]
MMRRAEWEANRMVWDNLPVTTRYFKRKEEAEGLPMRKALAIEEDIVLVCVGDESKAPAAWPAAVPIPAEPAKWASLRSTAGITIKA